MACLKVFCIFCNLVWLLHALSYFWVLLHEKIKLLVFCKVQKMICDFSGSAAQKNSLPATHYFADLPVETHILLFCVDKAEQ